MPDDLRSISDYARPLDAPPRASFHAHPPMRFLMFTAWIGCGRYNVDRKVALPVRCLPACPHCTVIRLDTRTNSHRRNAHVHVLRRIIFGRFSICPSGRRGCAITLSYRWLLLPLLLASWPFALRLATRGVVAPSRLHLLSHCPLSCLEGGQVHMFPWQQFRAATCHFRPFVFLPAHRQKGARIPPLAHISIAPAFPLPSL